MSDKTSLRCAMKLQRNSTGFQVLKRFIPRPTLQMLQSYHRLQQMLRSITAVSESWMMLQSHQ